MLPFIKNSSLLQETESPMIVDESSKLVLKNETLKTESPKGIISPNNIFSPTDCDVSSAYEAMESDVDSVQSASINRRPFPPESLLSTTTPGGSSDDDYSSYTSTKKRRKKHLRNGEYAPYIKFNKQRYVSPANSQIPSPSLSMNDHWNPENEDSSACTGNSFSFRQQSTNYNNSDSNLPAAIKLSRKLSNASEMSLNTSLQSKYVYKKRF